MLLSSSSSLLQSSVRRLGVVASRSLTTPSSTTYIHPLSQLVLQHLQGARGDWIQEKGLDKGLSILKDGTFVLEFPDKKTNKIWTSYEPELRQHWLNLQKDELVGQFMLQDNTKQAWSDNKSTPDKIHAAVDSMIERIDEMDSKGPSVTSS